MPGARGGARGRAGAGGPRPFRHPRHDRPGPAGRGGRAGQWSHHRRLHRGQPRSVDARSTSTTSSMPGTYSLEVTSPGSRAAPRPPPAHYDSAASPPRPPSRSSSSASARPSATTSTTSTRIARASSSPASCGASSAATSSSTSAARRGDPAVREQVPRESYRPATASRPTCSTSTGTPRPADHPVAHPQGPAREALRAGGPRDLRGHRAHRVVGPRAGDRAKIAVSSAIATSIRSAPASA
jgi:hypothetical protein